MIVMRGNLFVAHYNGKKRILVVYSLDNIDENLHIPDSIL